MRYLREKLRSFLQIVQSNKKKNHGVFLSSFLHLVSFENSLRNNKEKERYCVVSQPHYPHLDLLGRRSSSKTLDADCRKGRLEPFSLWTVVGEWAEPMMRLLMGGLIGYLLVRCPHSCCSFSLVLSCSLLRRCFHPRSSCSYYRVVSVSPSETIAVS